MTEDMLLFTDECETASRNESDGKWKLLIVDDEPEVHQVTQLVLADYSFDASGLIFLNAYSGGEAVDLIQKHPDTAVVLMDVVMETDQAGLDAVHHIRENLGCRMARIILRTGQPGHAPERRVILDYDINDYKAKSELTSQKLFTSVTAALRSYRDLNSIETQRKRLEEIIRSLNLAQEVQQCLLPKEPPVLEKVDISGSSLYCDETGGDYFDYFELPGAAGAFGVAVGDVSGHGVSAALLMAGARAYLRSRVKLPGSIADIVSDVNSLLSFDTRETGQFMTLFFLIVDPDGKALTWVRAGQDPAFLYTPVEDKIEELDGPGIAMGLDEGWPYASRRGVVRAGQVLLLATDGVWEAQNEAGEMFGKARFLDALRRHAHEDANRIRQAILNAVSAFQGRAALTDDVTLVVLKFR
ncbi:MAG: SpoIIE family protein phosphatase [Pseudomonadota bacterium]